MIHLSERNSFLAVICASLLLLLALWSCSSDSPDSVRELSATSLGTVPFVSSEPSFALSWPQFLIAKSDDSYLWAERGSVLSLRLKEREGDVPAVVLKETAAGMGMDRLIAADQSDDGTLVLLDTSGRVVVREAASGQVGRFLTTSSGDFADITISSGSVYLLTEGSEVEAPAVVAFSVDGREVGRWGTLPATAAVQTVLSGGGIAACPDGSVYYSFINSPVIGKVVKGKAEAVRALGQPSPSFVTISAEDVREAIGDTRLQGEVSPLVELGLGASRVMALHCALDGNLLRQVAHPGREGTVIEVWDPRSEQLKGIIHVSEGVLLDVQNGELLLGNSTPESPFMLERLRYQADHAAN